MPGVATPERFTGRMTGGLTLKSTAGNLKIPNVGSRFTTMLARVVFQ
jgi:hypothetical protein